MKQKDLQGIQFRTIGRLFRTRRKSIGLRMTAMIDVIFLLLIFFVLTTRFRQPEQFLPIQLPTVDSRARTIEVIEPLVMTIAGAENGNCRISFAAADAGKPVDMSPDISARELGEFSVTLAQVLKSQKRNAADPIEIVCHDEIKWDQLVKVYNVMHAMGISDITFNLDE